LIKALALALSGSATTDAVRLAWSGGKEADRVPVDTLHEIESQMIEDLGRTPSLRQGVKSGLSRLYGQKFPKVVLTESKQERVWRVIEEHGLERLIERVVEIRKEPQSYKRLIQVFRPSRSGIMVGDQLERDIRPAKAGGLLTIYFPSKFRPTWELRHREISSDYQIESFDQVPPIVEGFLAHLGDGQSANRV
jgi:FMN phosphatase YigB (HAD superfamily)